MIALVGGARATVRRHIANPPAHSLNRYVEHPMGPKPGKYAIPVRNRFWQKVDKRGPNECWPWIAAKDPRGYGRIGGDGRRKSGKRAVVLSHRTAYELVVGPIPAGMFVCHRCDNPPCCNPAHLFVATCKQNNQDMYAKGRDANQHTGRTHCQRGHAFDAFNTYIDSRGHRVCRACAAMHHRRYKQERKNG